MGKLKAKIKQIQNLDNLNIVNFDFLGTALSMMSLELREDVKIGKTVILGIKPTTVAIGKDFSGEISFSNQIKGVIQSIALGELLSSIKILSNNTIIESIITSNSAKRLNLKVNDEIIAIIKASEISILEVLDD